MQPLALDVTLFNMPGGLGEHIESALRRGLPEFKPAICVNDGTFVIVGSGPSLAHFADEIKQERAKGRPICAIKGAHDWLIDNDIVPDLFVSIDPRDRRNNVQRPSDTTIYLLASRCAPELFDFLSDRYVMLWHSASNEEENLVLRNHKIPTAIGGMSTSGLRAVNIGYFLGFRKFVMYGMDSCNAPDGITKRIDGSLTGQTIDVVVGSKSGKKFTCNVAMAKQAEDFQYLYATMPDITIDVKGDGLLAAIVEERKRQGKFT
jgi:hypothetical protein